MSKITEIFLSRKEYMKKAPALPCPMKIRCIDQKGSIEAEKFNYFNVDFAIHFPPCFCQIFLDSRKIQYIHEWLTFGGDRYIEVYADNSAYLSFDDIDKAIVVSLKQNSTEIAYHFAKEELKRLFDYLQDLYFDREKENGSS